MYNRVLPVGATNMAAGPHEVPATAAEATSAGRYRAAGRRWTWLVLIFAVAAVLVATSVYVLSNQGAESVLPVAWHLPDRCYQYCQLSSAGGVLYTLLRQNQPNGIIADGATYFSLQAYNWSSGTILWSVANFTVWGVWLSTPTALFVDRGTVAVVVSGDGEWVPGQGGPPVWFGPQYSTFVFEWNASTGLFLNQTHYGAYEDGIAYWGASESQGWIAVALASAGSSNGLIQSIPMVTHSGAYSPWSATVDPGTLPSAYCGPAFRVIQVEGMVSLWVSGGQSLVTLLSGSSGTELWQGAIPGWSSMETNSSGCQPESLAYGPQGLYYIERSGSGSAIELFNPTTHTSSTVASLSDTNASYDGLTLLQSGELIVADTLHDNYSAFSQTGTHLWTLGLTITVGRYSGNGFAANVWGTVLQPVELGTNSILLSMTSGGGGQSCNDPTCVGTLYYSLPLEIVNDSTAAISWQSSYQSNTCFGGCSGAPPSYAPVIGSGSYVVFEVYSGGSGSCLVARFAGVT